MKTNTLKNFISICNAVGLIKKNSLPICDCVFVKNNFIIANNLEFCIKQELPENTGLSFLVPFEGFRNFIKLNDSFTLKQEGEHYLFIGDFSTYDCVSPFQPNDFPTWQFGGYAIIDSLIPQELSTIFKNKSFVSNNLLHPVLCQSFVSSDFIIATNGSLMSRTARRANSYHGEGYLVSPIIGALGTLEKRASVSYNKKGKLFLFRVEDLYLYSHETEGSYPKCNSFFDENRGDLVFSSSFSKDAFLKALKGVKSHKYARFVDIIFEGNTVNVNVDDPDNNLFFDVQFYAVNSIPQKKRFRFELKYLLPAIVEHEPKMITFKIFRNTTNTYFDRFLVCQVTLEGHTQESEPEAKTISVS